MVNCFNCNNPLKMVSLKETCTIKGEETEAYIYYLCCDKCGEVFETKEMLRDNLNKLWLSYYEKLGYY